MARRAERAPTESDSRPEAYNERGITPDAQAAEPGPGIRERWSMRRKGWRKDPHGNGFLCPHASCKTAGDIHTRRHHDQWHEGLIESFEARDAVVDELRGEIKAQDETISIQSDEIDRLNHWKEAIEGILSQLTARGAYAIVEQVMADRQAQNEGETGQ